MMKRLFLFLFLMMAACPAFAQVSPQTNSKFMATPSSGTGYLGLRAITPQDFSNGTGASGSTCLSGLLTWITCSGGGGGVNSGTAGQLAYYAANGAVVSGEGYATAIPLFASTSSGLVSASGGGTTNFLRADGTWTVPSSTITQNLLPNTQWQIFSQLSFIQKPNNTGTAVIPYIAVTSNTTGNNLTTFNTTNTTGMLVGDVIDCAGSGVDAAIIRDPFRITSITANTSFSGYMAFQGVPSTSTAMTCTLYTVGDLAGTSGDGPDAWTKTPTLKVWREKDPIDLEPGSLYSLALEKNVSTTEYFTYSVPVNQLQQYWGRTITFGAWVYQKTQGGTGTFQLCIISTCSASGVGQSYGGFQWIEVSATIANNTNPVYVTISTIGVTGDLYYVSQPMLAYGSYIGAGNYVQNKGEYIQFINHINAPSLNPFSGNMPSTAFPGSGGVDYGYELDIEALTAGQIASTVSGIQAQVEFTAPTQGFILDFSTCMCAHGATFGIEIATQLANVMTVSQGMVPMDTYGYYLTGTSGYFAMYTGINSPGGSVSNITIDFSGARLN